MKITTQESLVAKVGFFGGDKPPQYQLDIMVELNVEEKEIIANAKSRSARYYDITDWKLIADIEILKNIEQYGQKIGKLKDYKVDYPSHPQGGEDRSRPSFGLNEWRELRLAVLLNGFYSFTFRDSQTAHEFKELILASLEELKSELPKTKIKTEIVNAIHKGYTEGKKSELEI